MWLYLRYGLCELFPQVYLPALYSLPGPPKPISRQRRCRQFGYTNNHQRSRFGGSGMGKIIEVGSLGRAGLPSGATVTRLQRLRHRVLRKYHVIPEFTLEF
jgi:hypothetical protein